MHGPSYIYIQKCAVVSEQHEDGGVNKAVCSATLSPLTKAARGEVRSYRSPVAKTNGVKSSVGRVDLFDYSYYGAVSVEREGLVRPESSFQG